MGVSTDGTLPGWTECREHDHHRVVTGRSLNIIPELVRVEAQHRFLVVHVHQLLDTVREAGASGGRCLEWDEESKSKH